MFSSILVTYFVFVSMFQMDAAATVAKSQKNILVILRRQK
jgi:hypothetical protein